MEPWDGAQPAVDILNEGTPKSSTRLLDGSHAMLRRLSLLSPAFLLLPSYSSLLLGPLTYRKDLGGKMAPHCTKPGNLMKEGEN